MVITNVRGYIKDRFSDLHFDPIRHIYTLHDEILPSVSAKVHEHVRPVDFETILPYSAKKAGVEVSELRKRWKKTNKDACDLGHETHDFLENFTGIEQPKNPYEQAGINFIRDILQEYEVICDEFRMYTTTYGYAGTADRLLRHRVTKELVLVDYKTTADLFKSYDFLKEPFESMESSAYNLYQFQLSYYQIMLEEIGLSISNRFLIHLKPDGNYRIFETIDLTNEIREYLTQPVKLNLW